MTGKKFLIPFVILFFFFDCSSAFGMKKRRPKMLFGAYEISLDYAVPQLNLKALELPELGVGSSFGVGAGILEYGEVFKFLIQYRNTQVDFSVRDGESPMVYSAHDISIPVMAIGRIPGYHFRRKGGLECIGFDFVGHIGLGPGLIRQQWDGETPSYRGSFSLFLSTGIAGYVMGGRHGSFPEFKLEVFSQTDMIPPLRLDTGGALPNYLYRQYTGLRFLISIYCDDGSPY